VKLSCKKKGKRLNEERLPYFILYKICGGLAPPGVQRVAKSFEDNNLPDGPPHQLKFDPGY